HCGNESISEGLPSRYQDSAGLRPFGGRFYRERPLATLGGGRGLMGRFLAALSGQGLAAIAEIKRRSPSAGDLRPGAEPAELAPAFERAGAAAVSVLVDERFAGSLEDLRAARASAGVPLLGKGFFRREEDLDTLKDAGADAALLLLRDLDDRRAAAL